MSYRLRKRPVLSRIFRVLMCRELVVAAMLVTLAVLSWALVHDKGVLIHERQAINNSINEIQLYNQDDLEYRSMTLEDLR